MLKIIELFGGIGACTEAIKKLNIDYKIVDYVDIDKYAVKSYNAINNTNFEVQDIKDYNKKEYADIIMHGSPCQDFSLAGNQLGGDEGSGTRSSLLYETIRIVENIKPKYVIWENVKNLLSKRHKHNINIYIERMEKLGYKSYVKLMNAKDYGIPQNRERVFIISIKKDLNKDFIFPKPVPLQLKLKDFLEKEVDDKYYLSEKMINYICKTGTNNYKNNDSKINLDIARPLTTVQNKRAGTTNYLSKELPQNYNLSLLIKNNTKKGYLVAEPGDGVYTNISNKRGTVQKQSIQTLTSFQDKGVVLDDLKIRRLTPKETWRLMGFSDESFNKAKEVCSDTQLYKQAGNSIVVNILEKILIELLKGDNYGNKND